MSETTTPSSLYDILSSIIATIKENSVDGIIYATKSPNIKVYDDLPSKTEFKGNDIFILDYAPNSQGDIVFPNPNDIPKNTYIVISKTENFNKTINFYVNDTNIGSLDTNYSCIIFVNPSNENSWKELFKIPKSIIAVLDDSKIDEKIKIASLIYG